MAHPYVPEDLVLDGFQPISTPKGTILGVFFAAWTVLILFVVGTMRFGRRLSWGDTLICCWLVLSGLTHIVTEGPVVWNADFFRDPPGQFFNELWKEYAKADSRYATRDECTIGIEAITAFVEGPICLLLALAFAQRRYWRHVPTVAVVVGELYGTVLYFLTSYFDGFMYQRKEPLYFWFYFVTMNSIWIVCPLLIIWKIAVEVTEAVRLAAKHKQA